MWHPLTMILWPYLSFWGRSFEFHQNKKIIKKKLKEHEQHKEFQNISSANLSWVELVVDLYGVSKLKVCTKIEKKQNEQDF
jgi:cytidylate kinase